jgi:hypothetical protein
METRECSCVECKKVFSYKGIFTHYDRSHAEDTIKSKYSDGNNGKYLELSEKAKAVKKSKVEKYSKNPKLCIVCGEPHSYERRNNSTCSKSCGAIHSNGKRNESGWKLSDSSKDRIRLSLAKHREIYGMGGRPVAKPKECVCPQCGISFLNKKKTKYCCGKCSHEHRRKIAEEGRTPFRNYARRCSFNFRLKDYPEKFDFSLIEEHGWYSASNHGNNLSGVSRDHMVSVRYGFDNNIDPEIIRHPANCQLMQHNKNSSKHSKCSITLEELIHKINNWNS